MPQPYSHTRRIKRRRSSSKWITITIVIALVIALAGLGGLWYLKNRIPKTTYVHDAILQVSDRAQKSVNSVLQPNETLARAKERPESIDPELYDALLASATTPSDIQQKSYLLLMNSDGQDSDTIEFYLRDPDRFAFIWHYPDRDNPKYQTVVESLSEDLSSVPLLLQWDLRWGYQPILDSLIYVAGCGPTSMSMVASYLNQDPSLTPRWMSDLCVEYGDFYSGQGTASSFFGHAADATGINIESLPVDHAAIVQALEEGKPVILHMGPGNFTRIGHFIVATGVEDGKLRVNDPNSPSRSAKLWDIDEVLSECSEMWAFSKDGFVAPVQSASARPSSENSSGQNDSAMSPASSLQSMSDQADGGYSEVSFD